MTARVYSHTPFTSFGKSVVTPGVQLPQGTNSMIIVSVASMNTLSGDNPLQSPSFGVGRNTPIQTITDNMGNNYTRIDTIENNSLVLNALLYEEIWAAFVSTPLPASIAVNLTYNATTIVSGDVIVIIPGLSTNQLMIDNTILTQDNTPGSQIGGQLYGTVPSNTTQIIGLTNTTALANELVLAFTCYAFQNTPPTTIPTPPSVLAVLPSTILENITNIQIYNSLATNNVPNTIGIGLFISYLVYSGTGTIPTQFITSPSGLAFAVLTVGIQEVPIASYSVQEGTISSSFSPEPVGIVSTPIPGLYVIKLPLGT